MTKPVLLFFGFLFAHSVSDAKTICVVTDIDRGPLKPFYFELAVPSIKFVIVSKDGTTAQELPNSQLANKQQLKAINGQVLIMFGANDHELSISLARVNVSRRNPIVLKNSVVGKADQPLTSIHYREKLSVGCTQK
jgi:hypothetical protein